MTKPEARPFVIRISSFFRHSSFVIRHFLQRLVRSEDNVVLGPCFNGHTTAQHLCADGHDAPSAAGVDIVELPGALDWSGFKSLVEAFARADLPLPSLNDAALRQKLTEVQAGAKASGALSLADLAGLAYEFVAGNLPTLYQWILKHPALLTALVRGASNLTEEEIAGLSAGEVLRVARAAYAALVSDGVFTEAACFFGEAVGLRPPGAATASRSASESKSVSPPQPAGA